MPMPSRADARQRHHQQYLNSTEAAAYLGVSPSYLAHMRLHGIGPRYFKVGHQARYDRGDLEAWIRGQPQGGTPPAADER
jgi:hypothetical protein